jgi:ankyrin repeat protein
MLGEMDEKSFWRAVKNGEIDLVKQSLADSPSAIGLRDKDQSTALHWAAWKGHVELAGLLLDHGADIQAHNENGHWGTTPLHAAAHGNQAKVVELLLARGADVNAQRAIGTGTPLGETRAHNATAAAKLLRAAGGTE